MCSPGQPGAPSSAADAVAMAQAGLAWLAAADVASLPAAAQADCLRGLEQTASMQVAASSRVLTSFTAGAGYEDDGHRSPRTWLKWQTRVTGGAAARAAGWARRLAAHPAVGTALAAGDISVSWAWQVCEWSDLLPAGLRGDADAVLLAAAAGGAELADLAALAQEMRQRSAGPDGDGDLDGFDERWVRLDVTFGGAASLAGGLTPRCAAAVGAVLDALGRKAGPEDTRTRRQRDHDALEEACRRLIAAGCLPQRAGQPTQIQLHMTLDQLRGHDTDPGADSAWAAGGEGGRAAAGPGDDCDAAIIPVVTGHVDAAVLDRLAAALLNSHPGHPGQPGAHGQPGAAGQPGAGGVPDPCPAGSGAADRAGRAGRAARQMIVRAAADLMSGPGGLASWLRTRLPENLAATVSLPLDIGASTDTIPVHLRRAVTARDRHCRFPGCDQHPAACQPHHLIPRAQGGPTSLANMLLLCTFHHLIAVHRWGWAINLAPDGTVTAVSPDDGRILHSHSPPAHAA